MRRMSERVIEMKRAIFRIGGECFIYADANTALQGKQEGMLAWLLNRQYALELIRTNEYIDNRCFVECMDGTFIEKHILDIEKAFKECNLI